MEDEILCPLCDAITEHVTVKRGREHLVKCKICGTVHAIKQEKTKFANLRVIVSRENTSQRYHINAPANEILSVGDELLVDDELHDLILTEIRSIETERRVKNAKANEIKTIWARAVDEVAVKVSVHKKATTKSYVIRASGNETLSVGDMKIIGRTRFVVEKIKLRNGKFADKANAKDILRIWGGQL
ncbi:MAG: HVO_0476 family zinc finger protein [Methanotrichaceae archaeon]